MTSNAHEQTADDTDGHGRRFPAPMTTTAGPEAEEADDTDGHVYLPEKPDRDGGQGR